ncbi:MAG: aspartate/glutamate racemase family protein [Candidatus Methylomirabilota bacterium]|jgi:allantoin racemase
MHILLINPNSTASMTAGIEKAARAVARAETVVKAVNPEGTPPAIEGYADDALAVPAVLALAEAEADHWDAILIACHGDPGLEALRERLLTPVIGIGEASFLAACAVGRRFSVLSLLPRLIPKKREQVRRAGLLDRLASVRALGVGAVESYEGRDRLMDRYRAEGRAAIQEDGADCLILGCAGMVGIAEELERDLGVPVVDPVVAAVKLAEACGPIRRGRRVR